MGAYTKAILSAYRFAQVLGTISPPSKTTTVKIPVARPVIRLAWSPKGSLRAMAIVVAKEDADRFTTLLPIRIALRSLL